MSASLLSTSARSQTAKPASAHLDSIEVTGSKRFTSAQIVSAIGIRPGITVNRDDLQGIADRIGALGVFSKVQYRFTTIETGVRVTYEVTDGPAMPVVFDNFPWFTDDELLAELKRTVPLFDGNAPRGGSTLDAMSAALENMIQARGAFAHVSHSLITSAVKDEEVQQFRVEGAEIKIQAIEFSDALAKNDPGIQDRLPDIVGKPFSRSRVELFEFEQVRPVYLSHAFLRVKFGPPIARLAVDPNKPLPDAVTILAPIDPGPAFAWGGVVWNGNSAVPSNELNALVDIKPGDTADGTKIEAVWERVRAILGERGYLDATLNAAALFNNDTSRVAYSVTINEGPQYHMGNLVLTGLSLEGEKRIRSAWRIPQGAVFNKSIYQDFIENGIKHAFAGLPVHYDKPGRFLQQDAKSASVDVLLDFQ
jgi:outer membrane protein assembly factor BamA